MNINLPSFTVIVFCIFVYFLVVLYMLSYRLLDLSFFLIAVVQQRVSPWMPGRDSNSGRTPLLAAAPATTATSKPNDPLSYVVRQTQLTPS